MEINIVLAILVTALATYISRFLGVLTSKNIKETSKIFKWFNCLAYSTLSALLARLIIFPEGSRTYPGQHVEYQSGIFGIYKYTKKAVIPVALNSGTYWPKKEHLVAGGTIIFEFLEPIKSGLTKDVFMKVLENKIETASNDLINS